MDINILEDFLKLAETSSFTRAAAERHITQPAFSRRIRMLEDYVGAELIDRSKAPIELTSAGVSFQASAAELLRDLQAAKDGARALDASDRFHVNLALASSVITAYLPIIFSVIKEHVDRFRVNVYSDSTERCIDSLISGDSHFLSVIHSPIVPLSDRLKQKPFAVLSSTRLIPVSKVGENGKPLFVLDLQSETPIPYLAYANDSYLLQVVDEFLNDRCDASLLDVVLRCNFTDGLIQLVAAGAGLAWLPELSIREELETGALVPAADDSWCIPLEYRMYGRAQFSPLVEGIIEDLRGVIERQA